MDRFIHPGALGVPCSVNALHSLFDKVILSYFIFAEKRNRWTRL